MSIITNVTALASAPARRQLPRDAPRVLCVDDEPNVLEGLRDGLSRSFDVHTAESGADALALLERHPDGFAVIISDMRMPVMSGSAFLSQARRISPNAVRLLLTGYSDVDAAIRAVNDGQLFRFEWLDGTVTRIEELAYQRWEGERIAEETFFYDPGQLVPKPAQA